jgi:hypothetical protein
MTQQQISASKNLGFIAKMNGKSRVPVHCKEFMDFVKNENLYNSNKDATKAADLWLKGWDEANLEYVAYETNSNND